MKKMTREETARWTKFAAEETRRTARIPAWRFSKSRRAQELRAKMLACAAGVGYEVKDGIVWAWGAADRWGCSSLETTRNIYPTLIPYCKAID